MKPSLRLKVASLVFLGGFFSVPLSISASAQNLTQGAVHALSNWHSVQALPAQTRIRITGNKKKTTCFIGSVTEDHLTCSRSLAQGSAQNEYAKEEIGEIRLTNRSRSTASGAALGAGVGVATGALIGLAINTGDSGSYGHVSSGKATGVGAAVGGAVGVIVGAAVGYAKDWFAGPVVYQRP